MVRVVLVDDQTLVRQGIRALLSLAPHIAVVGEASDGEEGLAVIARERPDVVLLDIQLPGDDGFVVAGRLQDRARIVLTSSRDAREYASRLAPDGPPFIPKAELSGPALAAALAAA